MSKRNPRKKETEERDCSSGGLKQSEVFSASPRVLRLEQGGKDRLVAQDGERLAPVYEGAIID